MASCTSQMIMSLLFATILTFVSADADFNLLGRGCCRGSSNQPPRASTVSKYLKVGSLTKCQQLCKLATSISDATCTAVEYNSKNSVCKVHASPIAKTRVQRCRKSQCYTASFAEEPAVVSQAPPAQPAAELATTTTTTQKKCTLVPGFDFAGGDLSKNAKPNVGGIDECATACIKRADCEKFTFLWNRCYLKNAKTGKVAKDTAVSAVCETVAVSVPAVTAPASTAVNTAAPAPPAPTTTAAPTTAAPITTAAPTTAAPTTAAPAPTTTAAPATAAPAPSPTATAADAPNKYASDQGKCALAFDVDYNKNDLEYGRIQSANTHADCASACLARHECSVFTFIKKGACYLKYRAGNMRSRTGAVSGVCTHGADAPAPAPAPTLQSAPASAPAPAPPAVHGNSKTPSPPPSPPVGTYNGQQKDVAVKLDFSFKKFAKLPKSYLEAQGAAANGKLYVFGGFVNGYQSMSKETWEWDPATTRWSQKRDIPAKWAGATHMANAVDKKTDSIYLLGGIVNFGKNRFPKGSVGTNNVFKYNAKADKWTTLPNLPEARGGGAAVVLNNKLHFFNGAKFDGPNGGFQEDMTTHWQLDLAKVGAGWKKLAPNSLGRNHVGGAVWGGKLYAIGGQFFEEEGCSNQKVSEVYDPKTNKWSRIADLPVGTGHISPSTLSTEHGILVVGGVTDKNRGCKPPGFKRQQILFYNPTTNKWTDLVNYHTGASMVSGLINGKVWAQHGTEIKEIGVTFTTLNKVGKSSNVESDSNTIAVVNGVALSNDEVADNSKPTLLAVGAIAALCVVALVANVVRYARAGRTAAAVDEATIEKVPAALAPALPANGPAELIEVKIDANVRRVSQMTDMDNNNTSLAYSTVDMFEDDDLETLAALTKMREVTMI
eukprot:gene4648-32277_t